MNIPWAFIVGVVLWLIASWIGPPAPIVLWTLAAIGLVIAAVYEAYRAYGDPEKKSLLMWGRFYFTVGFNSVRDETNDRMNKRSFQFEVGFERPDKHKQ